jgi:hypothetical protein
VWVDWAVLSGDSFEGPSTPSAALWAEEYRTRVAIPGCFFEDVTVPEHL